MPASLSWTGARARPTSMPPEVDPRRRGQRSIAIDLRSARPGAAVAERLVRRADVVIEGMRPGAMERLGLGAERCRGDQRALIYAAHRLGAGRAVCADGRARHQLHRPDRSAARHGRPQGTTAGAAEPAGRLRGGSVFAVIGVFAALLERRCSGQGQVVDGSIVEGVVSLCTATIGMRNCGLWGERGRMPSTDHGPGIAPTRPPTRIRRGRRNRGQVLCGAARETRLGSGRMATPGCRRRSPAHHRAGMRLRDPDQR